MQYLDDEQHYIDLYDLLTIKECLRTTDSALESFHSKVKAKSKDYERQKRIYEMVIDVELYFIKGEEYKRKKETIREWMEEAGRKQNFYDKAIAPDVSCLTCGARLYSDFKMLMHDDNKPMRVLFFFSCKTCKKNRAFYDNGEERISEPPRCPKCNGILGQKDEVKKNTKIITLTKKCPSCGFTETSIEDFEKSDKEFEEGQRKDKELLEKYRSKFCLSDEEGQKYIVSSENLKRASEFIKEAERKQADPVYQKVKKLNKLNVVELEKLLSKTLENQKYIKLSFDKPEIGQYVIIPFTVQEADSTRKEYDTTGKLKKLLKKTLEDTNWRLMTEGVSYRLGYVYGRLKGYEREDDLANLMRIKPSKDEPVIISEKGPIY
jgi:hypothetical protein